MTTGVAGALGGDARLADELVVAERAGDQVEQGRADQRLLLAEEALAGLAHRAHPELVVEDQEGGRLAGQRVARAAQDHAHAAAVADALAELRAARRVLRGMAAARAEPDRLGPTLPSRRPRPVDPNESRHAERSQHGRPCSPPDAARSMHRFGTEPCAKPAQVRLRDSYRGDGWPFSRSSGGRRPRRRSRTSRYRASRVPAPVVRWLGRIKAEAARVNAELGLLDADIAERVAARGRRGGRRPARRPVPDRRLPDRLRHLLEHERQRGDREPRRRGRAPERPREHGAVVERRVPVGGAPGGGGQRPDASSCPRCERSPPPSRARPRSSRTW